MSRYMILFRANLFAWPTDPKGLLALTEKVAAGGDYQLKTGQLKEIGWFSNTEGYAIAEGSMEKAIELAYSYNPYYSQEIREMVPWEKGKEALLASARAAAAM